MRRLLLVSLLVLGLPAAGLAGENPDARFCMHLIATNQYLNTLYTTALAELTLADINQDLSAAELTASTGYGYVVLCAYNITRMSGVEFMISGWPTTRGAPAKPVIAWEDPGNTLVLSAAGFPFDAGGVAQWGASGGGCDQTSTHVKERAWWGDDNGTPGNCKVYPFAYFPLSLAAATSYFPINLSWAASTYSYGGDPHNYVMDCTINFVEDTVLTTPESFGCTIGGSYTTPIVTQVEPESWSTIKALYR